MYCYLLSPGSSRHKPAHFCYGSDLPAPTQAPRLLQKVNIAHTLPKPLSPTLSPAVNFPSMSTAGLINSICPLPCRPCLFRKSLFRQFLSRIECPSHHPPFLISSFFLVSRYARLL